MERAVVLTPAAATGIGGGDGVHYAAADSDAELVARCTALLSDSGARRARGKTARRFVVDTLSWQATLAPLSMMLGLPQSAARNAA